MRVALASAILVTTGGSAIPASRCVRGPRHSTGEHDE